MPATTGSYQPFWGVPVTCDRSSGPSRGATPGLTGSDRTSVGWHATAYAGEFPAAGGRRAGGAGPVQPEHHRELPEQRHARGSGSGERRRRRCRCCRDGWEARNEQTDRLRCRGRCTYSGRRPAITHGPGRRRAFGTTGRRGAGCRRSLAGRGHRRHAACRGRSGPARGGTRTRSSGDHAPAAGAVRWGEGRVRPFSAGSRQPVWPCCRSWH